MTAYIKPFEYADIIALGFPDDEDNRVKTKGPAFTLMVDDKPVACGGIIEDPTRPGVGRAWTAGVREHQGAQVMRHIHASVKYFLNELRDRYERIEADCLPLESYERWLKRLGFSCEGYSPKYYHGQTYARYARIQSTP
jgi:hypothetical protein